MPIRPSAQRSPAAGPSACASRAENLRERDLEERLPFCVADDDPRRAVGQVSSLLHPFAGEVARDRRGFGESTQWRSLAFAFLVREDLTEADVYVEIIQGQVQ